LFQAVDDRDERGVASTRTRAERRASRRSTSGTSPTRSRDERLDDKVMPLLSVGWVHQALHRRAMVRLRREGRPQLSLTDCVSFDLMLASGIGEALALDRHFADAGFRVLPRSR
jgi:predicted nucleic acid-binding protein